MKRFALSLLAFAVLASGAAEAGQLQKALKGDWLGAWVVTRTEASSDCGGAYTDNRVNGTLVKSSGAWRFQAGELAKLDKVDLKRSRMDLLLTLQEPFLVPYQDGPFTLYREAWCQVELEIEIPRELVKGKDEDAIEQAMLAVLERYATEDEAIASGDYNGREREDYPDDYETTLARHAVWQAEQVNAAVQDRLDHAVFETARLTDRVDRNPVYLQGFAEGVTAARGVNLEACPNLLSLDLGEIRRQAARAKAREAGLSAEWISGYEDGKVLVYGLEMIRNLPACRVPVPALDEPGEADLARR
jgi:hypothetical protein